MDFMRGWSRTTGRARSFSRLTSAAMLLVLPVLLAGCLQMERTVRVNPDGSGVLIERLVMGNEIADMMAGMQTEGQLFAIRDDDRLRANAASFGESVRFVSARDIVTDFGRGYEARYAFDDINLLQLGQDIEESMPGGTTEGDTSGGGASKFTTFTLHHTSPAQLVIHWPVNEGEAGSPTGESDSEYAETAATPEQEQMAMEMMRMAFKDMRFAVHVEVMGDIVETNAMHRSGSRVTLMDIDFGALVSDESVLQAMAGNKPASVADMKQLMTLVPGLKIEIEPEVAILFR